jgi:rhodanese-related sulfurtransferase
MVSPISTDELMKTYDKAIIIDTRNEAEYDVVHIVGAKNVLVGKMKEADLLQLRPKQDKKPLVFYCNGITCAKSYKAAKMAVEGASRRSGVDDGIFARQRPIRIRRNSSAR